MRDLGQRPVPSTGPYVIARAAADTITLERNPAFEEWSAAAQPDGLADVISWRFGQSPANAVERLRAGTIDVLASQPEPQDVSALQETNPERVLLSTASSTLFVGYDVLRPPFADVRVRRALNDAIDRERIVDIAGGADRWRVACQIFPPSLQGYQPLCPYTTRPEAGVWSAPVLARAKALVRRAGAQGQPVTVWASEFTPGAVEIMRHVVDVLNEIGLRATLKVVPDPDAYFDAVYRGAGPGSKDSPQVYLGGWVSDYPRASDFVEPLFRCHAPANASGYCNPRVDTAIDDVKQLSTTNAGAADRAWTAIEHQLVRDAVWTPLFNPVLAHVFSARTGNVQIHPQWGVLLSRAWVE